MQNLQQLIGSVRNIRGEMNIPPHKKAPLHVKSSETRLITQNDIYIKSLAMVESITVSEELAKPKYSASAVIKNMEIFVPLEGLIDFEVERKRLQKEITRLEKQIESTERKLINKDFLSKAPQHVIDNEKQKSNDFRASLEKLVENFKNISEN